MTPFDRLALQVAAALPASWAHAVSDVALDAWWASGDRARAYAVARMRADHGFVLALLATVDPDEDNARKVADEVTHMADADHGALLAVGLRFPAVRERAIAAVTERDLRRMTASIFDGAFTDERWPEADAVASGIGRVHCASGHALTAEVITSLLGRSHRDHAVLKILLALHVSGNLGLVTTYRADAARIAALSGDLALGRVLDRLMA